MNQQKAEEPKKLKKSELRPIFARDASKGMTHLWNLGHQALSIHPGLAGFYISQFQNRSIFSEVAVQEKLKTNYCQSCGTIFVPGATCSVKLKKKNIPKQSPENQDSDACPFKARTYDFKNSIKVENLDRNCPPNSKRRKKTTNSLRYSCLMCQAITFVPVPKKPCSIEPPKATRPQPNKQGKICETKAVPNPGKPSNATPKKDDLTKQAPPVKSITNKTLKQTFQPKPTAKKKGAKLNLSKILENDKKSKEESKSKPQGFSLGDFLKDFN